LILVFWALSSSGKDEEILGPCWHPKWEIAAGRRSGDDICACFYIVVFSSLIRVQLHHPCS
jgi:hypothetical protein